MWKQKISQKFHDSRKEWMDNKEWPDSMILLSFIVPFRCTFVNFRKNKKCLECSSPRHHRNDLPDIKNMKPGDWICPGYVSLWLTCLFYVLDEWYFNGYLHMLQMQVCELSKERWMLQMLHEKTFEPWKLWSRRAGTWRLEMCKVFSLTTLFAWIF